MSDLRQQAAEHLRFAGELGVAGFTRDPRWGSRPASRSELSASGDQPLFATPAPSNLDPRTSIIEVRRSAAEALAAIKIEIGPDCPRCKLATLGRTQVVFGVGNPDADLMFVGEAPGGEEDIQGIPFVGRAGQLLTKMILAINLERDQVYIANVIKCRPPGNRNPEPDEIDTCEPFLFQQIDAVRPRVIVALGAFAARTLLRTEESISRLRGRVYDFRGAKLIPTFHPSFLLRSPDRKRDAWEDLKKARALLTSPVTRAE
ncbi:MAG TPA: uracil-DNA glycosylase [Vicinamibacterales bacterium]